MKIKRFNEKVEPGHMTLQYVFDSAEQVVGFNMDNTDNVEWLNRNYSLENDFTFEEYALKRFDGGYFIWPANNFNWSFMFVYVGDSETPKAIINVGELFNPFVFQNMVIAPGRDYVIAYNWKTGESKKEAIR